MSGIEPVRHQASRDFSSRRRVWIEWLAVAAASTALVVFLTLGQAAARWDNIVYDGVSRLAPHPPAADIVIVAMDNRSLQAIGRWPWPRDRHTQLLRQLARLQPKAIAYDVLFLEPDRDPIVDQALARALRAGPPVFLPLSFDIPGKNGAPVSTVTPTPPLDQAAAGIGQVNVRFDSDSVVRRAFLAEDDGAHQWPHLMEQFYRVAEGRPSPVYRAAAQAQTGGQALGLAESAPALISYAGPPGSFRTISAVDVLNGQVSPDFVRGKLVLVGATADGLGDKYSTPVSGNAEAMSGVELQANLLNTLIGGWTVRPAGPSGRLALSLAPLWLLLAGFLRLPPRANLLLGLGLMAGVLACSAVLFLQFQLWTPPVAALAGLLVVYPLWSWRRLEASSAYMVEELKQFAREPGLLSPLSASVEPARGDLIDQQLDLMRSAISRNRDLQAFIIDALWGLPDPVLVSGLDGQVILANHQAETLFQSIAQTSPKGAALDFLRTHFTPPAPPETADGVWPLEPGDELTSLGGHIFNARRSLLLNSAGQAVGWIVRLTDITLLKAAGQQREHILQLLTHDMRSPQVSILALIGAARPQDLGAELAGRLDHYARQTLALADNFVHMARAERPAYDMEIVDFGEVLLNAVDDLWPQSSAKQISVQIHGGDDPYLIQADHALLARALLNLIDNALKYTSSGGRVDCRLAKAASLDGPQVVCAITDTGRGMDAQTLNHLFERFKRAPSRGLAQVDGVGLGLSFVQTVISRHGGEISCESLPGQGATFTVRLPLCGLGPEPA